MLLLADDIKQGNAEHGSSTRHKKFRRKIKVTYEQEMLQNVWKSRRIKITQKGKADCRWLTDDNQGCSYPGIYGIMVDSLYGGVTSQQGLPWCLWWMIVHGVSSVIWWSKKGICIGRSGQSEALNCAKNAQNLNISIKNLVMETRTFRKISAAFCTHKVGFSDESLSEAEHHQMGHMTTSLQRRWGSMERYWTFSKGWDFTKIWDVAGLL